MQLPAQLSRNKKNVHKNSFGHVFILAGSSQMLGAGALCALSALRSGAGLVTLGVPKSLNSIAQKKISNSVMTLPLNETKEGTLALSAFNKINSFLKKATVLAIGPGLSTNKETQRLIRKIIKTATLPLVIDADALNALAGYIKILNNANSDLILTPHHGEMARLIQMKKEYVEENRKIIAQEFAKLHNCTLLLKGPKTLVAQPSGKLFINTTGNAGMATAGSGDVLTGMIAAFRAQGLTSFQAAKWGATLHGMAADRAAKKISKLSIIAQDLIDNISIVTKT